MTSLLNVPAGVANRATRTQHAIRLMALLAVCGEPTGGSDPTGTAVVIRSERKLQALDFWLRNPDYLADELITAVQDGHLDETYLDVAHGLLHDAEPAWHHYPMPKWFYGAFEYIDDAFALLYVYGLGVVTRRGVPPRSEQNQFFLTTTGKKHADELVSMDVLAWYPRQAELVKRVARADSGSRLKQRQYEREQYEHTSMGADIDSIAAQVAQRLTDIGYTAPAAPSPGDAAECNTAEPDTHSEPNTPSDVDDIEGES